MRWACRSILVGDYVIPPLGDRLTACNLELRPSRLRVIARPGGCGSVQACGYACWRACPLGQAPEWWNSLMGRSFSRDLTRLSCTNAEVWYHEGMTEKTPTPKPKNSVSPPTEDERKAVPRPSAPEPPKLAPRPKSVYGGGSTDEVLYSRVRDHTRTRKSLTIKQLQRKLGELGHGEATADLDGHYGALTAYSVEEWQKSLGHEVGPMTAEEFAEIFKGDPNVSVTID